MNTNTFSKQIFFSYDFNTYSAIQFLLVLTQIRFVKCFAKVKVTKIVTKKIGKIIEKGKVAKPVFNYFEITYKNYKSIQTVCIIYRINISTLG